MSADAKSDRVAVITGAGRGIGRATAIDLAAKGYSVALVSRSESELKETAGKCGGKARIFLCDVSDSSRVDRLVDEALGAMGRIDALCHCAGLAVMKSIETLTVDEWRAIIDTNLSSIVYFCRKLWPIWRKQGGGVMVNVSSRAARDPFAGLGAYGAAKAGVNLLGLALASGGAEIGVRVHTVAPAATETAMLRSLFSKENLPESKTLTPEAVARVIVQCVCGDLDCTSGEVIYVHK